MTLTTRPNDMPCPRGASIDEQQRRRPIAVGLRRRGAGAGATSLGCVAVSYGRAMHRVRPAGDEDRIFVIEMARIACTLEDRPLPDADAPEVLACLPPSPKAAVIAIDEADRPLGAAWWHMHDPSMLLMSDGSPIPELTLAVADNSRGHGIGARLIEALVSEAATDFSVLALNVHLRNPASTLYMRAGFRVAGKGRGSFGVAMTRELRPRPRLT
jgi:GNAT superfamily N-acetyltransferase